MIPNAIMIIGREKEKKGPNKGQFIEVIKRKLEMSQIGSISLRYVA